MCCPAGAVVHGVRLPSQGLIKPQMSENNDPPGTPVSVRIDKWLDGKYGPYAYANVLTPDAPSTQALFSRKKFKTEPALGVPFDCHIDMDKGRWRVVAVASEPEPVEKELRGYVESSVGRGYDRSWIIKLAAESGSGHATLTTKVLRAARFAHVECGQELTFIALSSDEREWVITSLLSPKVAEVVDASNAEDRYLAFAISTWRDEGAARDLMVAVHVPPSKLWPLVYVKPYLLTNQSIRCVYAADLCDADTVVDASGHLSDAAQTLQCGTADELADLSICCLQITLKWEARQRWCVDRLIAPLSLREPEKGEIIEWVMAKVTTVPTAEPELEPAETSIDDTEVPDTSPAVTKSVPVWMTIDDPRIGRGRVSGFLKTELIAAAGLAEGVQTVVSLMGKPPYWNIKVLHRSIPLREDV